MKMKIDVFSVLLFFIAFVSLNAESISHNDDIQKVKIELGHRLFYDADLSINGTFSCATCHEQKRAFSDGNSTHPGVFADPAKRNVPSLANVGEFKNLNWADNSLKSLSEQSLIPIKGTDPIEMGMDGYEDEIRKRLSANKCYQKLFKIAFKHENGAINLDTVSQALEGFEKTLISKNSLYDKSLKSAETLLSKDAVDGEKLYFGTAKCNSCHSAPLFSDDSFHQVQFRDKFLNKRVEDFGLFDVTGDEKDRYFFRTPSLRNVSLTAPYWHDGSVKTLKGAILNHNLEINQQLNNKDIKKIVAFLETLTDYSFVNNPKYGQANIECRY